MTSSPQQVQLEQPVYASNFTRSPSMLTSAAPGAQAAPPNPPTPQPPVQPSPDPSLIYSPAIIRRLKAIDRLEGQIPKVNITSVIVRVAQLILLMGFSLAFSMSRPPVFLDIFVWPINANPPFEVHIYRNTSEFWALRLKTIQHSWSLPDPPRHHVSLMWEGSSNMLEGLGTERYVCKNDKRWNCTGEQWAMTRLGWVNSWPFGDEAPDWARGMIHIEQYVFFMVIVGSCVGIAHNMVVLTHAIDPSGVAFYKYTAAMDITISVVFLLLGIFPMAIQRHLEGINNVRTFDDGSPGFFSPKWLLTDQLKPHQRYAFCMGWMLWAMYVVTFMLSLVLVADLTRYESLPSQIRSHGLPEFDPDLPDDLEMTSTTGYQASASRLDPKRAGSYRRYSGRERGATSM
ncbi:Protein of unknown function [Pyronema omphalodes CBS 100304]|uniref:Uncharacterized protein n=1 Tax=Pyronema omphalodes (strain CBS 100304) TaxID=1076935 RepID=U4LEJ7_PYROM|nr:Protein of unknown function [Pyronema omphalodes CBS 100304]